jgi:gamma-glutamyltranspeptidase/glutathione hydrolase
MRSGLVVASRRSASDAGAEALAAGGSAADAAVAAAFALSVVDPANCGLGGYGGFLTYAPPGGAPVVVDFNTWVPDRLDPDSFPTPGTDSPLADGGPSVAPPMVLPGLLAAHERFGRLPLERVVSPAILLARDGTAVDRDLSRSLVEHWERTRGSPRAELGRIFFPHGRPPPEGTTIVQPELAATLETIASEGADAFRGGPIVAEICESVAAEGGSLEPSDFGHETVAVIAPETACFGPATAHGPPRSTSGAGVLLQALAEIDASRLGENRSPGYITELVRALTAAWNERTGAAAAAHTTTLAAADADGALAALTFTQGAVWFGSGIAVPGTGIVLNAGANLFAAAPSGAIAVTNMCPILLDTGDGTWHALGATGGPRIPGILLSAVVDVVHYGATLEEAIAAPHLAVRAADGALWGEPEVLETAGHGEPIAPGDFGPAAGITRVDGRLVPAVDPRFAVGISRA